MKKINFNKDWRFIYEADTDMYTNYGFSKYTEAIGAPTRFLDHSNWKKVDLPHDFVISLDKSPLANNVAGGFTNSLYANFYVERRNLLEKANGIGWYRKEFYVENEFVDKRVFIEFEGVFRDSIVWVNGVYIDRHTSGYTGFEYEITDHLVPGEKNSIAVRVDSEQPEGWWYEGGGIYRNVWLKIAEPVYLKQSTLRVVTENSGECQVYATVVNDTDEQKNIDAKISILDKKGCTVASTSVMLSADPYGTSDLYAELKVENVALWSVDVPNLYTLRIDTTDVCEVRIGYRTAVIDADHGFLLNGKPLKLHGACVHQDLGGVGVALTDELQRYKIARLKEMGVNAYRCSHHAPSPALLDACDELGMLVMDETRIFGTSVEGLRQLTDLIERDRNHPSVFIWCIGNEEFAVDQLAWSRRIVEKVNRTVKSLDPTRQITYASTNGEDFIGANAASEVRGINYIRNGDGGYWTDRYHADHPTQPIIGTEQSSYVLSRGSSENDFGSGVLDCFGDVTMMWGSTPRGWAKFFEDKPYLAGGFMWTGFDYRGEPNPYVFSDYVSSFGTIDLAGMEKPPFYYYKSFWTNTPTLKLLPHWNYKEGATATVGIYTNCESVELFLNDKKIGEYRPVPFDNLLVKIPFERGRLTAVGKHGELTLTDTLVTSGETVGLEIASELICGEEGISILEVRAVDKDGVFCPLADNDVEITSADGTLVGACNGAPTNLRPEQPADVEYSEHINMFACDNGELYAVPPKEANTQRRRRDWLEYEPAAEGHCDDYRLVAKYDNISNEQITKTYTARISGVKGYQYVEFERLGVDSRVYLNGVEIGNNLVSSSRYLFSCYTRPFRFYCDFDDGVNTLSVVSVLPDTQKLPFTGYVKIGKIEKAPMRMRLHYGKMRLFVRAKDPTRAVSLKLI